MLRNSPLLESFKKNDIEVLIMDEEIDTIVMPMVNEFDKTPIKSISHADINDEIKSDEKVDESKVANTLVKMKEILKDEVKDVRLSSRLSSSAAVLIYDKNDPDFAKKPYIKWNFTKFLVDKSGNVVARFEPTTSVEVIEQEIKKLLEK